MMLEREASFCNSQKKKHLHPPNPNYLCFFFEKILVSQVVNKFAQTLQGCFVFKTIYGWEKENNILGKLGGELYWGEIY